MTFTALPREEWADIRQRLEKDPVNKKSLELIDSSYSILILDTESPGLDVRIHVYTYILYKINL